MKFLDTQVKTIDNISLTITPLQDIDGNIYFFPKEIEKALNYKDLSHSIRTSDGFVENIDYKIFTGEKIKDIKEINKVGNADSVSKANSITLLTESGLYAVLLKSRKPLAQKFRIWVTSEVLPSIRKTGSYYVEESSTDLLTALERNAQTANHVLKVYREQLAMKQEQVRLIQEQSQLKEKQSKLEQEQIQLKTEVHNLTSKAEASLESIQYYSVASYARAIGYIIKDLEKAKKIGKACVRESRKMCIPLGNKVPQGSMRVNTYHLKVIKSVFDKLEKEREQDSLPLFDSLEDRELWRVN